MFCFRQTIMKDRWINMGWEEQELKPYKEPAKDILDTKRIGKTSELVHTMPCIVFCSFFTSSKAFRISNIVIIWCL